MLPDATVRYADHEDAVIDLHLPRGPADQLLVLIHGGFWKAEWDRRPTRPFARALADAGCLVATPEYRRVGNGGGWPVTAKDVRLATLRLPELLESLGLATPAPLVVAGHSAGGHLALWLATTDLPIHRVVGLAPVCNLGEAVRLGLGSDATKAFMGDHDPAVADPMVLLDQRPAAEVAIVHGVVDDEVPVSMSRGLTARHTWVELHEIPDVDHYEVIAGAGEVFDLVLGQLRAEPETGGQPEV